MISIDIVQLLHDQGIGVKGVDLFRGDIPPPRQAGQGGPVVPHDVIGVYHYVGGDPLRVKQHKLPILEYPRFQVAVLSKSFADCEERVYRIYYLLEGWSGVINGVRYSRIDALGTPSQLDGRDEENRVGFVCNFRATKEPSPPPDQP